MSTDLATDTEGGPKPRKRPSSRSPGLDGLTDKQRAYVTGRTAGMSRANAYRTAYDTTSTDPASLGAQGQVIERSRAVQAALQQVRAQMEIGKAWDIKRIKVWVFSQLVLEATTCPVAAGRVKALELLGKEAGMFQGKPDAAPMANAADLRARLTKMLETQEDDVPSEGLDKQDAAEGEVEAPHPQAAPERAEGRED